MYFPPYSKTQDYETCTFEGTSVASFKLWYILLSEILFIIDPFLFFIIPFGIKNNKYKIIKKYKWHIHIILKLIYFLSI